MVEIVSRVVPVGAEWAVELQTERLDLRYGPYPTPADAEAVRQRITAALEAESLAGVTDRQGDYVPAGAPVPRPVQLLLIEAPA